MGRVQLEVRDAFCGAAPLAWRERYSSCHRQAAALRRELDELAARAGALERDRDLLAFEIEEIEALDPSAEDEELLAAERARLRKLDALRGAAGVGAEALAPEGEDGVGAVFALAEAERLADSVARVDPELDALAERLRALRLEGEDLGAELRRYVAALDAEPGRLEEVEVRLEAYEHLARKHGGSVEAVLAHAGRCRGQRAQLDSPEVDLERVRTELAASEAEERDLAAKLGKARRKAAPQLAEAVRGELAQLAMADATFEVAITDRDELR